MLEVLYEDNHLIAVNKPAGIGVQGDSSGDRHLLDIAGDYLKEKYKKPGAAFVGLIHRLDRPVSGVVLLAKTSKGLSRMNEQFRNKSTHKIYHAITENELPENEGTLTHWLGKDSKTHRALSYSHEKPGTKLAVLHYTCIAKFQDLALYEIELETGRFHQIRAQLAKSKAPIVGDVKYGADAPLSDRSIALHARKLSFTHPISGAAIEITAPYPKSGIWQKIKI